MINHPLHVIVKFGSDIPVQHHGTILLELERVTRRVTGLRAEVFKEARGDDSKLRMAMTPEQRAKL